MREEAFVRAEIRLFVERARVALDLPPSAVAGCTDEQIGEVVEAQQVPLLPAELLRVAGVHAPGIVLGELLPASAAGWDLMLLAKDHARKTAAICGSRETFGPERAVFFSDPGGNVFWLETREPDSAVWALTERTLNPRIQSARFSCWLEHEVVTAEMGSPRN